MPDIYHIPTLPLPFDMETKDILKQVNETNKKIAELKGLVSTIPNEQILVNCLTLQEAKDSSDVENIVTTQDDLYQAGLGLDTQIPDAAIKEVLRYREAIMHGFNLVRRNDLLTVNIIKEVQRCLVNNSEGFRTTPGTTLKNSYGQIVYTPPQDIDEINRLMRNLEVFINDDSVCNYDPMIKMSIIHHQFESIHPFGDGNGRTGRIMNILFLVLKGSLDLPVLYLSKFITHNKPEYYRLIQAVRDKSGDNKAEWIEWVMFMLKGIEETADFTISLVNGISQLMNKYRSIIKPAFGKKYKRELLNNLFFHPYTKIEFLMHDLGVSRPTAVKYLDDLADMGLLEKEKRGKENYYINAELVNLFVNQGAYKPQTL